jgi:hypothetical protein
MDLTTSTFELEPSTEAGTMTQLYDYRGIVPTIAIEGH